jgi:NodT family efflux transporter outer membrane factor (OMF) lipoprotein
MTNTKIKNIIIIFGLSAVLAGCSTSQYIPEESKKINELFTREDSVKINGLYGSLLKADSVSSATKPWDKLYTDAHLQQLIKEGIDNNFDLKIAVQQMQEVEAYFGQSKDAFLPAVSASAEGVNSKSSESLYPGSSRSKYIQLGAEASWEIDIWGKLRSSERASYAALLASEAGKNAVKTRLIADIATSYYKLMALDAELAITEKTVKNYTDLVTTMKALQESGNVTEAAVVQSEAARYAAEVTIPDLKQQILEQQNALCLLLGRSGSAIERGKIEEQTADSLMYPGVPAMLLDNRPDVMQARYLLMKAYETTKSAYTYFYPSFTITASCGLAAADLSKLFNPSSFLENVIGGLAQPILNKGANTARLKVAQAQQEEALYNFKIALLSAGNEVQNALGSYESSVNKAGLREKQLDALVKSVDYTRKLLTYGTANYTEVLSAETSLLAAQLSSINDRLQQLNATVSLYRALGGGWK